MNEPLRQFFEQAKQVSLTAAEKNSVRIALQNRHIQRMKGNNMFASAKDVALQATEKSAVKSRLEQFMQMHPAQTKPARASFMQRVFMGMRNPFSLQALPATAAIVGILVSSTGGLTYAAESSVPGDSLYPVKVSVTEPIREAMAFRADQKARVHLWRMERRLQEAEELLLQEDLDDERRETLESYMEDHADFLEDRLEHMRDMGSEMVEDIEDDYAVLLEFHESAMERLAEHDGSQSAAMLQRVRGMRERRFGNDFEPRHVSAERLQRNIQQVEQHVAEVMQKHPEKAEEMHAHFKEAKEKLQQGDAQEAFRAVRPQQRHHDVPPGLEKRDRRGMPELPIEAIRPLR